VPIQISQEIRRHLNHAIHRLHRRMREERQFVFAIEPLALRQSFDNVAHGFCDDAVLLARGAQVLPDIRRADLCVRPFVPGDGERVEPFLAAHM